LKPFFDFTETTGGGGVVGVDGVEEQAVAWQVAVEPAEGELPAQWESVL
jgi:hypothetical protein